MLTWMYCHSFLVHLPSSISQLRLPSVVSSRSLRSYGHFYRMPRIGRTALHIENNVLVVSPVSGRTYHVQYSPFKLWWFYLYHQSLSTNGRRFSLVSSILVLKILFREPANDLFLQFPVNYIHTVTRCELISYRYYTRDCRTYLRRVYFCPLPIPPWRLRAFIN